MRIAGVFAIGTLSVATALRQPILSTLII